MPSDPRTFTYAEALAALAGAARFGIHPTLETTRVLCERLGTPQDAYASVQVTGTNGKSSTTRLLASILRTHGVREGTYTSPELVSVTERIEVAGTAVTEAQLAQAIGAVLAAEADVRADGALGAVDVVTEFELLTVAALWLFARERVDVACLEVGMGGRWDATSVVAPSVAVVTGVALDHVDRLGCTREEIAADKAHVIKPGSVAILGPGTAGVEPILLARAEECGVRARAVRAVGAASPLPEALTSRFDVTSRPDRPDGMLTLNVNGAHRAYHGLSLRAPSYQAANVATALAAAEAVLGRPLDPERTSGALATVRIPGRFELVRESPPVVLDAAHNPEAARLLADAIGDAWPSPGARPALLLGILSDKDARGIVAALAPSVGEISVAASKSHRALSTSDLAEVVRSVTGAAPRVYASVPEALDTLVPRSDIGLVVTGSITTAGEARDHLLR